MGIVPYLNFEGNTAQAIEFYKNALNCEVVYLAYMDSLPGITLNESEKKYIANSQLVSKYGEIMMSDVMERFSGKLAIGNNVTICIVVEDVQEGRDVFDKLSVEGKITMPYAPSPWSPGYGVLTDKFGIGWQINTNA